MPTNRDLEAVEEALTRADLIAIRGPDLKPVLPPDPVKRTVPPSGHGTRYRWLKGCRCRHCHDSYRDYLRTMTKDH